jgi:hypothetical protein
MEDRVSEMVVENGRVPAPRILSRVWDYFKGQVVQPVPDDDAPCEFNCRVGQCTVHEWQSCEIRLRSLARTAILSDSAKQPAVD